MQQAAQTLKLYRPYLPWYFAGLAAVVVTILAGYLTVPYNSDDVSVQILAHWASHQGNNPTTWVAPDTFALKLPFYWLLELMHFGGRGAILFSSLVFNLFGFGAFGAALAVFARRHKVAALHYGALFTVTCAVTAPLLVYLANPNFRNAEFGAVFLIIGWIAWVYNRPLRPLLAAAGGILVALLGGALIYSDPYFLYTFFIPSLLFVIYRSIWQRAERPGILVGVSFMAAIVVGSLVAHLCAHALHYQIVGQNSIAHFVSAEQLLPNIAVILRDLLMMYDGNIFGREALTPETLRLGIQAAFAVGLIVLAVTAYRKRPKISSTPTSYPWLTYFAWLTLANLLVYLVSQTADDNNFRYFISFYFMLPFVALVGVSRLTPRHRRLVTGAIFAIGLFNIAHTIKPVLQSHPQPNVDNYVLIQRIQAQHASKGYASYWDAPVTTYLSRNQVLTIQSICISDRYKPFGFWLSQAEISTPAAYSFILIDHAKQGYCTETQFERQFGTPIRRETYLGHYVLLFYPYDIGDRMGAPYLVKPSSS